MPDPIAPTTEPQPAGRTYVLDPVDVRSDSPPPEEPSPEVLHSGLLAPPSPRVRNLGILPSLGLSLSLFPLEIFKHRLITQGLVLNDAVERGEIPSGQAESVRSLITVDRFAGQSLGVVEGLALHAGIRYSREDWIAYPLAALGTGMAIYRLAASNTPDGVTGADARGYEQARLTSAIYPLLGTANGLLQRIGDSTESTIPGIIGAYGSFGTGLYFTLHDDRAGMDRDTGTITLGLAGTHLAIQPNPVVATTGILAEFGAGTYLLADGSPVHSALLMQTALSTAELRLDSNWSYVFDLAGLTMGGVQLGRGETAAGLIHGVPSLMLGTIRLLSSSSDSKEGGSQTGSRAPRILRSVSAGTIRGPQSVGTGLIFSGEF